uniref:TNase-like domain-containing protein n=1 Tax=Glossina brevipalpis TaxID=37001 RepID=A0A1A9X5I3_9MUSC
MLNYQQHSTVEQQISNVASTGGGGGGGANTKPLNSDSIISATTAEANNNFSLNFYPIQAQARTTILQTHIAHNAVNEVGNTSPTTATTATFLIEKGSENTKRFSVNNLLELAQDCHQIASKLQIQHLHHQHQHQHQNNHETNQQHYQQRTHNHHNHHHHHNHPHNQHQQQAAIPHENNLHLINNQKKKKEAFGLARDYFDGAYMYIYSNRKYAFVWCGDETGENVVQTMVKEGLDQAKHADRGKWSNVNPAKKIREIKGTQENPAHIFKLYNGEPVRAIIEHVRDGSTVRAFLLLDFYYITLMISVIRCPGVKLDQEGTVVEVFNGDDINVKLPYGLTKKVFFSSIRIPRDTRSVVGADGEEVIKAPPRGKIVIRNFFSREFLRKKLVGKKVQCVLDYNSPARDNFPEKCCYTVLIGGQDVAEAMAAKGLASYVIVRTMINDLVMVNCMLLHVNDLTLDHSRIKVQYLPSWQRALRTEGIVKFVAGGSRIRLYIPKDSCLVTFLLAGISCPHEALAFTRDRVLQRDVSVHIDTTDKNATSVIGWLWLNNNVNLSVALVEEGLANVHLNAEKSEYYRMLKNAEDRAKAVKKNVWANYVEKVVEEKPVAKEVEGKVISERKVQLEDVIVTEITENLSFFAQSCASGAKLL